MAKLRIVHDVLYDLPEGLEIKQTEEGKVFLHRDYPGQEFLLDHIDRLMVASEKDGHNILEVNDTLTEDLINAENEATFDFEIVSDDYKLE
jgi:hypothetical protein